MEKYLKCENCGFTGFTPVDEEYEAYINASYVKNACECMQCLSCGNIQPTNN